MKKSILAFGLLSILGSSNVFAASGDIASEVRQFLNLSAESTLQGQVSGGASGPCYLDLSSAGVAEENSFVAVQEPSQDSVTILSPTPSRVSSDGRNLTAVSVVKGQNTIPVMGGYLGSYTDTMKMVFTRTSGTQFHLEATMVPSGLALGQHEISMSCDFEVK